MSKIKKTVLNDFVRILGISFGMPFENETGSIDWNSLVRMAVSQKLNLVLFRILVENKLMGLLDTESKSILEAEYFAMLAKTRSRFVDWLEFQPILEKANVPYLVINGFALVSLIYDNELAQDHSRDIDLIIPKEAINTFQRVAGAPLKKMVHISYPRISLEVPCNAELLFPGGVGNPADYGWKKHLLDVKTSFLPFPSLDGDINPFENVMSLNCNGMSFKTPRLSVQVLNQALHAMVHRARKLFFFYELALLCHKYEREINWDEIAEFNGRHFAPLLYNAFEVCQEYFPVKIPPQVLKALYNKRCPLYRKLEPLDPIKRGKKPGNFLEYFHLLYLYLLVTNNKLRFKLIHNILLPPRKSFIQSCQKPPIYIRYWLMLLKAFCLMAVSMIVEKFMSWKRDRNFKKAKKTSKMLSPDEMELAPVCHNTREEQA